MGGYHHPELVLVSPSYDQLAKAQRTKNWPTVARVLADAGKKCVSAGADLLIIPSSGPHFAYDHLVPLVPAPVVNIVDNRGPLP